MLNLHLLECTVKGYDHISDLLLAKYWVITGCKYLDCICYYTLKETGQKCIITESDFGRPGEEEGDITE